MRLIEALKLTKELLVKAEDIKKKVSTYCADQSHETPTYGAEQKETVRAWIQAYQDIVKEILHLKYSIQKTNINTAVTIELGGKNVTKSIAEWIIRRRELAAMDYSIWSSLTDRGLREGTVVTSTGEKQEVKIRRYYDPRERDSMVELYRSEPSVIDRTLEVVNCTTELIEN